MAKGPECCTTMYAQVPIAAPSVLKITSSVSHKPMANIYWHISMQAEKTLAVIMVILAWCRNLFLKTKSITKGNVIP